MLEFLRVFLIVYYVTQIVIRILWGVTAATFWILVFLVTGIYKAGEGLVKGVHPNLPKESQLPALGGIGALVTVFLAVVGVGVAVASMSPPHPTPASPPAASSPAPNPLSNSASNQASNNQPKASSPAGSEITISESPKAGSNSEQAAVENAIRGHYGAIGAGDFQKAYSYLGPTLRNQLQNNEQGWIDSHKADQIRGTTINSIKVNSVSGDKANATVDVSSDDKSGTSRFILPWDLVKENGQWKLDNQVGGQRIA